MPNPCSLANDAILLPAVGTIVPVTGINILVSTNNSNNISRMDTSLTGPVTTAAVPGLGNIASVAFVRNIGGGTFFALSASQFCRSTDGGATWTAPAALPITSNINVRAVGLTNALAIFVFNSPTVYVTTNGTSFTTVNLQQPVVAFKTGSTVFGGWLLCADFTTRTQRIVTVTNNGVFTERGAITFPASQAINQYSWAGVDSNGLVYGVSQFATGFGLSYASASTAASYAFSGTPPPDGGIAIGNVPNGEPLLGGSNRIVGLTGDVQVNPPTLTNVVADISGMRNFLVAPVGAIGTTRIATTSGGFYASSNGMNFTQIFAGNMNQMAYATP